MELTPAWRKFHSNSCPSEFQPSPAQGHRSCRGGSQSFRRWKIARGSLRTWAFLRQIQHGRIAQMRPFPSRPLSILQKYLSDQERNRQLLPCCGLMSTQGSMEGGMLGMKLGSGLNGPNGRSATATPTRWTPSAATSMFRMESPAPPMSGFRRSACAV